MEPSIIGGSGMSTDALEMLETLACNAGQVQACVLTDILTRSCDTEYFRQLDLGGSCANPQAFKRVAPLVTYADIKPLIRRIVEEGDQSPILTAKPIPFLSLSSGTSSGEPKLLPTQDEDLERRYKLAFGLPCAILTRSLQEAGLFDDSARKTLHFLFARPDFQTPGGLPVRNFVTNIPRNVDLRTYVQTECTSPVDVLQCTDNSQSMYCQLLCGLIRRSEVGRVAAVFATGILRVMHFLEARWRELVEDIRAGTLNSDMVSDSLARASVEALIAASGGPNPALAQEIETECEWQPKWQGIVRRLWPKAKAVSTILTGTMAQYVSLLEFYTDGLPLVSLIYACTEGYLGVNVAPLCPPTNVSYMLIPHMAYFEFLPLRHGCAQSTALDQDQEASPLSSSLIDLVDVKLGEDYELVLTTYAGLYRYRVGDVLRVSGFHHKAPLFQFVRRANVLLSIDADKTDEETLQRAVEAATSAQYLKAGGWHLVDYTSYADVSQMPGHYVLYWELQRSAELMPHEADQAAARLSLDAATLGACCFAMEEKLDSIYRKKRVRDKSIGPLEIRVVQRGTFDAIMEVLCLQQQQEGGLLMRGASFNYYKTPRCVNKQQHGAILELLNSRVSVSAFSPQEPSFTSYFSDY